MKKRLIIGLLLLFLFSTYNIKFNKTFFSNLQIKKITIENNKIIKDKEIKEKLSFLYETNILFTDIDIIEKKKILKLLNVLREQENGLFQCNQRMVDGEPLILITTSTI